MEESQETDPDTFSQIKIAHLVPVLSALSASATLTVPPGTLSGVFLDRTNNPGTILRSFNLRIVLQSKKAQYRLGRCFHVNGILKAVVCAFDGYEFNQIVVGKGLAVVKRDDLILRTMYDQNVLRLLNEIHIAHGVVLYFFDKLGTDLDFSVKTNQYILTLL